MSPAAISDNNVESRHGGILAALRAGWLVLAVVFVGLGIALAFLLVVLRHTKFCLPIEDAYIYLTYAKQFGRGEPFTYFAGGGYSAGSTSIIWPMLLAPFWTVGARGEALPWVSFIACALLYTSTGIFCALLVRKICGTAAAIVAAGIALGIAPFAFTALSGMEVALASSLLVGTIYQLHSVDPAAMPRKTLLLTLAALALSRPELMVIAFGVVGVHVADRVLHKRWRAAAMWTTSLVPTVLWLIANRLFAGTWLPNTGVAKSHFYLPGFDWTYWWDAVTSQTKAMLLALFWDAKSPFVWPRLFALAWISGAARIIHWSLRSQKVLVGALIVFAPIALMLAVNASSGSWPFHNYRYIACVFPLLSVTAACGIAPPSGAVRRVKLAWSAACLMMFAAFAVTAYWPMRADMDLYAQDATDLNRQVITIGHYVHDELPNASIMFHDAGAIAYYGDRPVFDMLGLVTNHQARIANNGPGSRFEFLESLPPEQRPTHFAYYPGWMGQSEFFGEVILRTPLDPAFHSRRLIGGTDMELIAARWDHVHTAEAPLALDEGWQVVDRVDVADIASEDAHSWSGSLGRRKFGDPTARWSVFHKEGTDAQLRLDGGRTIRGGTEQFTIRVDPAKPVRLLLRTGGLPSYPYNETLPPSVALTISDDSGTALGSVTLPAPTGTLIEVPFDFRATAPSVRITTHASGLYRVFHWFVLQPLP